MIFLLVFGPAVAYFALQNTSEVTLHLGSAVFSHVPLFYIILGSALVGVILSYIVYLTDSVPKGLVLKNKDKKIKEIEEELNDMTKKAHQLEIENVSLKKENGREEIDEKSM